MGHPPRRFRSRPSRDLHLDSRLPADVDNAFTADYGDCRFVLPYRWRLDLHGEQ